MRKRRISSGVAAAVLAFVAAGGARAAQVEVTYELQGSLSFLGVLPAGSSNGTMTLAFEATGGAPGTIVTGPATLKTLALSANPVSVELGGPLITGVATALLLNPLTGPVLSGPDETLPFTWLDLNGTAMGQFVGTLACTGPPSTLLFGLGCGDFGLPAPPLPSTANVSATFSAVLGTATGLLVDGITLTKGLGFVLEGLNDETSTIPFGVLVVPVALEGLTLGGTQLSLPVFASVTGTEIARTFVPEPGTTWLLGPALLAVAAWAGGRAVARRR